MDTQSVIERMITAALAGNHYESVFGNFCDDLCKASFPLLRAHLGMNTLHPMLESVELTWWRGRGLETTPHEHHPALNEEWARSPMYWMLEHAQPELRRQLTIPTNEQDFPIFEELREVGATDYLGMLTPFGDPGSAAKRRDGIITSWVTNAAGGFTDENIAALQTARPYLGLVAKLAQNEYAARNVVAAYLGDEVGRRVLDGQIKLGDVERIPAVIWFSDLRNSTAMAERMPVTEFLQAVNDYFGCTAGAVLESGGQVLRFIGDAVLAVYPIDARSSAAHAAKQALIASEDAQSRMAALNSERTKLGKEALAFGLGLHVGEVLYGNIGVPTRLEFSVIGSAANEVSRLESLTKEIGETVLVSAAFAQLVPNRWRALGTHKAKGVESGIEVFAPAPVQP